MTRTPMALAESGVFTNLYSVLGRADTAKLEVTLLVGTWRFAAAGNRKWARRQVAKVSELGGSGTGVARKPWSPVASNHHPTI